MEISPPGLSNLPRGAIIDAVKACREALEVFLSYVSHEPSLRINMDSIAAEVLRICQSAAQVDVIASAETDASGFFLPPAVVSRDHEDLRRVGSLGDLIRLRHEQSHLHRFNVARCLECFHADPELPTLLSLAREGARIDTATTFSPVSEPDQPRHLLSRLPHTISKHVFRLWSSGAVLVLPREVVSNEGIHLNNLHWCPKPGAPEGRLLGDCSNREHGAVLNSEEAKCAIERRYGSLHHPTIGELVRMVQNVADKAGGIHNIMLWKEDISGAFGQYNHHVNSAPLLSFPIGGNMVMIYLVGMFGWTGSPFVFGVFSRAFRRQCNAFISGELDIYVDDFMGASPRSSAHEDQRRTQEFVRRALGESAINASKTVSPARSMDFIGWLVDLDSQSIRPNDKGIRKLVVSFFDTTLTASRSLQTFQVMASLACRYSQGLVGMRPFVQPLHTMTQGWSSGRGRRSPSSAAKLAILMWRTVAVILISHPTILAVPMDAFSLNGDSWSHYIISDAGPFALGVAIYDRTDSRVLAHASYRLPYVANDPRFQNAREYHGLLLGDVLACMVGIKHANILWRGDNIAALSWARKNSCSSSAAQRAFLAHTWLSLLSGNVIVDAVHQAGSSMGDIDGLSRFKSTAFNADTDVSVKLEVDALFTFCDPTKDSPSLDGHLQCLNDIIRTLAPHINL